MDSTLMAFAYEGLSKGQQTKLRILERSVGCLARKGFEGSSFSELADTCDVTRALIVHHFQTKESLIQQAILFVAMSARVRVEEFREENIAIKDPMERYIHARFEWLRTRPEHASFLGLSLQRAAYDLSTRKLMTEIVAAARSVIAEILSEGIRERRYPAQDPERSAHKIHAIIVGMTSAASVNPEELDFYRDECASTIRLLLKERAVTGRERSSLSPSTNASH